MKLIEVNYDVVRDGETILEGYADVDLTDKNIKEVAEFIRDNHFSGELCDVPSHVYDRIQNRVNGTAYNDMKAELHDELYIEDEVIMQPVLPISLINLLPDDVVELIDKTKIMEYYSQFEDADDDADDQPTIGYYEGDDYWRLEGEEEPTDMNTLYLPIKQIYFDQIVSGEKTIEYREIKLSTYKKYLECDKEGYPSCYDKLLAKGYEDQDTDIYTWNNGIYPFVPKTLVRYLKLAVGYNKERDIALVELDGFKYSPIADDNGKPMRFIETEDGAALTQKGKLCFWNIEFHIKRVVNVERAKKG